MRSTPFRLLAVLFAGALVLAACGDDDDTGSDTPTTEEGSDAEAPGTIVDVAVGAGDFTTLVAAVEAAGLAETLSGDGPFTVFAPTDAAFAALPEGTVDDLLADPEALAAILTFHVVAGALSAADVLAVDELVTVNGASAAIDADAVTIEGASIVATDIAASNGIIHVIDAVILPPQG